MNTCKFIKPNKEQCKTRPLKSDIYCFFHSEKMKDKHKEAVTKGGNSIKKSYGREDAISLNCVDDILLLLEQTANDLRQNKINNKTASILNFIAGTTLKAVEAKYIEKVRAIAARKTKDQIELEKILYPEEED